MDVGRERHGYQYGVPNESKSHSHVLKHIYAGFYLYIIHQVEMGPKTRCHKVELLMPSYRSTTYKFCVQICGVNLVRFVSYE